MNLEGWFSKSVKGEILLLEEILSEVEGGTTEVNEFIQQIAGVERDLRRLRKTLAHESGL